MATKTIFLPDDTTGEKVPNEVLGEQLLGVSKYKKITKIERKDDQPSGWIITYEE
ncbi:hypothetical protein [Nitrosomonas sp.]|uniref:hypothetical protein n=1 Tax=Nitrosomonas sp. TaxID=42353 RepID=UPI001DF656E1|nr:hypothetical protein [Nitrosomonas sp.]MBX3616870.1 hypothetical protein [Nitrosomonas sp.]